MVAAKDVELLFVPLDDASWPGPLTGPGFHVWPRFTVTWLQAKNHLKDELAKLDADTATLEVPYPASRLYVSGAGVHRDAGPPRHHGVALSFTTPATGPLRFCCDQYGPSADKLKGWQANVRAIALTLEALRTVDRHGAVRKAEQYRGWTAIAAEASDLHGALTREEAARVLADATEQRWTATQLLEHPNLADLAYRAASKVLHPDAGGKAEGFDLITRAREALTS